MQSSLMISLHECIAIQSSLISVNMNASLSAQSSLMISLQECIALSAQSSLMISLHECILNAISHCLKCAIFSDDLHDCIALSAFSLISIALSTLFGSVYMNASP